MPYDWAPCPNCGWKAPEPWEPEADLDPEIKASPAILSKPRSWISITVWVLLGALLLGVVLTLLRHS